MKARRLLAVSRKEFIHIIRDPRSLGLAIAIPMLLLFLFGYALTLDVDNVPLIVWDQDKTPTSREFISRFVSSAYFSIQGHAYTYREVERAIDTRHALVALIIPTDFAERIHCGRPVAVQAIVDGSDSNTATLALGYAEVVTRTYSRQVALHYSQRIERATNAQPLDVRPRVWYNEDLQSRNYIIPGLIAVIMMIIAALLTSLTVAKEWERGTMEQIISTPVRPVELILGKLTPYFTIGMIDVSLAILAGEFLFNVPLRGNVVLLFLMAAIFLAVALSLGILISIQAKNTLLASQMAILMTFVPSFLLSGFMFAISNMPKPIQLITYLIPARYFVAVLKLIYLKGLGLKFLAVEAALLVLFGALLLVAAIKKFKKELVS